MCPAFAAHVTALLFGCTSAKEGTILLETRTAALRFASRIACAGILGKSALQ